MLKNSDDSRTSAVCSLPSSADPAPSSGSPYRTYPEPSWLQEEQQQQQVNQEEEEVGMSKTSRSSSPVKLRHSCGHSGLEAPLPLQVSCTLTDPVCPTALHPR